jgi:hypothetical protein
MPAEPLPAFTEDPLLLTQANFQWANAEFIRLCLLTQEASKPFQ